MNMPMALRQPSRSHAHSLWSRRMLPWLLFAAAVAWMLHMALPTNPADTLAADAPMPTAIPAPVQWKDADHDWLLVVDQTSRELVVYDAVSGRPLRRLGAASGTGPVDSIIGAGRWLVTTSRQDPHLHVLSLPGLQPATFVSR